MIRTVTATLVFALVGIVACNAQPPAPKTLPPSPEKQIEQVKTAGAALAQDLRDAKVLASAVSDPTLRAKITEALTRAEKNNDRLQKAVIDIGGTTLIATATADEFNRLLASIKKESFDDNKLPLLRDAVKHKGFTCQQAVQIVKAFTFAQGQKDAAVMLHPRLTDPINFHEVLKAMTFDSDRQEVRKRLGIK